MNLFRSEEHVRAWSLLADGGIAGVMDPNQMLVEVFRLPRYRRRLDEDYLDRVAEHSGGLADALRRLSDNPWWAPAMG